MEISKIKNIIIILLSIAVLALTGYLVLKCFELKNAQSAILAQQINEKTLRFANLFVDKLLSGQAEVSFEDRLELENSVRALNDQQIFVQWQKFTKSASQPDAQRNLGDLLKLLIKKISY